MKLYTYKTADSDKEQLAVGCEKEPDKLYPLQQFDMHFSDMTDLITHITPADSQTLQPQRGASFFL